MILFFGLLRPYKGLDTLLTAFREVEGAELWIVGNPRMDVEPLRRLAAEAPGRVRFVTRFVEDAEIPPIFRRADLVVLPYRDAEHSGVLYTGLAFGKPLVLSAVGGFPEVATTGAARLVPPGDPAALAAALSELTADPAARERARRGRPRRPPPAPTPGTRWRPRPSPSTATSSTVDEYPTTLRCDYVPIAGIDRTGADNRRMLAFSSGFLRRADRLHAPRLPAGAAPAARPPSPPDPGARRLGGAAARLADRRRL